jgi:hypothetical protein
MGQQGYSGVRKVARMCMVSEGGFVKDPSTPLRISLGGSDAAGQLKMYSFAVGGGLGHGLIRY